MIGRRYQVEEKILICIITVKLRLWNLKLGDTFYYVLKPISVLHIMLYVSNIP